MIRMPDIQTLTTMYRGKLESVSVTYQERYDIKAARLVAGSQNFADADADYKPLTKNEASRIAADEMARDMSYFRERMSSATINFHSGSYSLELFMGVVNDTLALLTVLRVFLQTVPAGEVEHARLDTRVECFQEQVLLETRRALRKKNLVEHLDASGYSAVPA